MRGLWKDIILTKYIKQGSFLDWIREQHRKWAGVSTIWSHMMQVWHLLQDWLVWVSGDGRLIRIGEDLMIGETRFHKLLENLIKVVHMRGIYVLTQVSILSETSSVFQQCKNVDFLNLKGEMGIEWTQYLQGLRHLGIQYLSQSDDHLIWSWNEE